MLPRLPPGDSLSAVSAMPPRNCALLLLPGTPYNSRFLGNLEPIFPSFGENIDGENAVMSPWWAASDSYVGMWHGGEVIVKDILLASPGLKQSN
jgi:hypothetical protein